MYNIKGSHIVQVKYKRTLVKLSQFGNDMLNLKSCKEAAYKQQRVRKTEKNSHQNSFSLFPVIWVVYFSTRKQSTTALDKNKTQTDKNLFQAVLIHKNQDLFFMERKKQFGECYSSREKKNMFNMVLSFTSFAFKQIQF